jgi:MFS family permease
MKPAAAMARLPATVWALGFVSLFMDASSELVHAVLPLFLATALGASMATIGWIEGVAEAIAQFGKFFSGVLSDRMRRRRPWVLAGYGLSALTKPLFPLASNIGLVIFARFSDRVGKGLRDSPRDALLADVTSHENRGAAYGLRQALDTVGAIVGPLAATWLLFLYAGDIRATLWWATLPAMLCVLTIMLFVREPPRRTIEENKPKPTLKDAGRLPRALWLVVAVAVTIMVARFAEAFLILRATSVGVVLAEAPLVMIAMNVAYALTAYPAGLLSDRLGRRGLLFAGTAVLVAADVVLGSAGGFVALGIGVALWGLHMGLTQGLLSAMVADAAPAELRGTAFGVFYAASGVATLVGSAAAGLLWDAFGAPAPFYAGAAVAGLALLVLLLTGRKSPARQKADN